MSITARNSPDRQEPHITTRTKQLGAVDPERKTSPVAWEADEDTETLRESVPDEAGCFFNDRTYDHGTVVKSGSVLLRCDHGLWLPAGAADDAEP